MHDVYANGAPAVAMRLDLRTCAERWRRAYRGRARGRSFSSFFFEEQPSRLQLPVEAVPYNVWDEDLFACFFPNRTDPRREGHGCLRDLYRVLHGLSAAPSGWPAGVLGFPAAEVTTGSALRF